MALSSLHLLIMLLVGSLAASAMARGNQQSLPPIPPPPDLAGAAATNDTFELPPEETPGSPTKKCLERLTTECANVIDEALATKSLNISRQCCKNALVIGKTCWTLLIYTESDDPCHFLRQVINYCAQETNLPQTPPLYESVKSCDYQKTLEYKRNADTEGLV